VARKLKTAHADRFVLAGDAVFTVVRHAVEVAGEFKPEVRFTYRVQRAEGEEETRPWFVKVLTGPNNLRDYQFCGSIFPHDAGEIEYRHGRKSRIGQDAPSAVAIDWLVRTLSAVRQLAAENMVAGMFRKDEIGDAALPFCRQLAKVEIWHEGRCGRCARRLTVPASIVIGIGPECAEIMGLGPLDKLALACAAGGSDLQVVEPDPCSEQFEETPQGY
jgi:hypothetical protein